MLYLSLKIMYFIHMYKMTVIYTVIYTVYSVKIIKIEKYEQIIISDNKVQSK